MGCKRLDILENESRQDFTVKKAKPKSNIFPFTATDNIILDPFASGSYNRYGYVLNNPLKYTDPTGNCPNQTNNTTGGDDSNFNKGQGKNDDGKTFSNGDDEKFYEVKDGVETGSLDEIEFVIETPDMGWGSDLSGGGWDWSAGGPPFSDPLNNIGYSMSVAGTIGDKKIKSGRYTQLNGKKGNFNDRPYKKLSKWAKTNKNFAKNLQKLGKVGNGLVLITSAYDLLDDGNIKTSTLVNGALTGVAIFVPVTAPFILGYQGLDLIFDISGMMDANTSGVTLWSYDD